MSDLVIGLCPPRMDSTVPDGLSKAEMDEGDAPTTGAGWH